MRALHARGIQYCRSIRGHQRHRVQSRRCITLAAPAIIKGNRAILLIQHWPHAMPQVRRIPEPHDEQDRLAASLLVPVNLRALILNKRHSISLPDSADMRHFFALKTTALPAWPGHLDHSYKVCTSNTCESMAGLYDPAIVRH